MAEALGRWLREEMELPPSAVPSPAALRRLCSGPTAPVWDFVTRHVRSQRNVEKIRGNLRWSRHLQELEAAAAPPGRQGALLEARARLRQELQELAAAAAHAQEAARRLEASLGAAQGRRWAELRRGAELRLLGAEPRPAALRGGLQGALQAPPTGQSQAELSAILASGVEPEVLVSIKALCKAREAELRRRPRPPRAANHPRETPDWLEQAEAVLIGYCPGAVLWALEALANQSTRALLAGPAPSAEAPPTLRSLLQERWGAVGGVWGELTPLLTRLAQLRGRLGTLLERDRGTARLSALVAALGAVRSSLQGALRGDPPPNPQNPQNLAPGAPKFPNPAPKAPKFPDLAPKPLLGALRRRLRRGRSRVLWLQQRLRFLSAAARGRRAGLRPLQEQVVGVARAGPAQAPPLLEWAGQQRRELPLVGLAEPRPPSQAPPPLQGLARELSSAQQGALLPRAAILRLRLRQGALRARRGAWPAQGAWPEPAPPLPEGVAELLAQLRLVSASCRQRINDWPRLQELVSQWWSQPAQWALATPPGQAPFSHWLQRWRAAAYGLQATPTEEEGAGPGAEAPPP